MEKKHDGSSGTPKVVKLDLHKCISEPQTLYVYPPSESLYMDQNHFSQTSKKNSKYPRQKPRNENFVIIPESHCKWLETSQDEATTQNFRDSQDINEPGSEEPLEKGNNVYSKKSILPSQTLLNTAAYIKSCLFQDFNKSSSSDGDESVKNKLMGIWHTMKYGWSTNMKTNFSKETAIYMLGKVYHRSFTNNELGLSDIERFKLDFRSLMWFTYRQKFSPLQGTSYTSDCGWGCMLRSSQMIMSTALRRRLLPIDWTCNKWNNIPEKAIHERILRWFFDYPSRSCPFSLHNLVRLGNKMNRKAGSWYGPSCTAHILKEAMLEASKNITELQNLVLLVAQDGAVYIQDVMTTCSAGRCVCISQSKSECHQLEGNVLENNFSSKSVKFPTKNMSTDHFRTESTSTMSVSSEYDIYEHCYASSTDCGREENNIGPLKQSVPTNYFVSENNQAFQRGRPNVFAEALNCTVDATPTIKQKEKFVCDLCQEWKSCIILVPVRLGSSNVNPIYHQCIYSLFLHDLCIGVIGGRPKHSLYFVGFQEESLLHLDPHLSQDTVIFDGSDIDVSTYHCCAPRKMDIAKMDPSCTIGFYCHTRDQFLRLIKEVPQLVTARDGGLDSSIFEFIDGHSDPSDKFTLTQSKESLDIGSTAPISFEGTEELIL